MYWRQQKVLSHGSALDELVNRDGLFAYLEKTAASEKEMPAARIRIGWKKHSSSHRITGGMAAV